MELPAAAKREKHLATIFEGDRSSVWPRRPEWPRQEDLASRRNAARGGNFARDTTVP